MLVKAPKLSASAIKPRACEVVRTNSRRWIGCIGFPFDMVTLARMLFQHALRNQNNGCSLI
jgi:hypothetical protein